MTDVVVNLRADAARALSTDARNAGVLALRNLLRQVGAELRQQHPGVSDPQLQTWYTASVESPAKADQLAAGLRKLDVVEAAYVQPPPRPA
jgi:hypothetical protein